MNGLLYLLLGMPVKVGIPKFIFQVVLQPLEAVLPRFLLIIVCGAKNVIDRWIIVFLQLHVDIGFLELGDDVDTFHGRAMEHSLCAVRLVEDKCIQCIFKAKFETVSLNDPHLPRPPISFSISRSMRKPKASSIGFGVTFR